MRQNRIVDVRRLLDSIENRLPDSDGYTSGPKRLPHPEGAFVFIFYSGSAPITSEDKMGLGHNVGAM